jgi:hypothetical protein
MLRWWSIPLFLTAALGAGRAAAQRTDPAADADESSTAEQTELSFSAENTGLQIQIVDGGPGRIPEGDCRTPCRFRVPNGYYTLRAGSHEFQVTAQGGLQHWQVEDDSGSLLAVGVIGLVVGAAAVGVGTWGLATLVPQDNPDRNWLVASAVGTGIGGAAFIGGIVALALSFGSADMVSFSPSIGEAATLSPGVAICPRLGGRPGLAFSLALRL